MQSMVAQNATAPTAPGVAYFGMARCWGWPAAPGSTAGCGRPVRLGPGAMQPQAATRIAPLPAIALAEVEAGPALDSSAILYRLAFADGQQLRPRAGTLDGVAGPAGAPAPARAAQPAPRCLSPTDEGSAPPARAGRRRWCALELEEFSHWFESPTQAAGCCACAPRWPKTRWR